MEMKTQKSFQAILTNNFTNRAAELGWINLQLKMLTPL